MFSITLAASAIFILFVLCVPATIISLYSSSTSVAISGVEPEVTFKKYKMAFEGTSVSNVFYQKVKLSHATSRQLGTSTLCTFGTCLAIKADIF